MSAYFPPDVLPPGVGNADEVCARLAASVIVLREPFEILMLRRHARSSFVPSAWVFPGGAADEVDYAIARASGDASETDAMRVAAVRELFEETGLWLGAPLDDAESKRRALLDGSVTFDQLIATAPVDLGALVFTSRWITPVGFPKRFDAFFFLARAPQNAEATLVNDEAVDLVWISPPTALERHNARDFELVFPTVKNLEALTRFSSIGELMESRRGADVVAITPRLIPEGDRKRIVLP